MSGFFRRTTAGLIALALASGSLTPTGLYEYTDTVISANAVGDEQQSANNVISGTIYFTSEDVTYGNTNYTVEQSEELFGVGKTIAKGTTFHFIGENDGELSKHAFGQFLIRDNDEGNYSTQSVNFNESFVADDNYVIDQYDATVRDTLQNDVDYAFTLTKASESTSQSGVEPSGGEQEISQAPLSGDLKFSSTDITYNGQSDDSANILSVGRLIGKSTRFLINGSDTALIVLAGDNGNYSTITYTGSDDGLPVVYETDAVYEIEEYTFYHDEANAVHNHTLKLKKVYAQVKTAPVVNNAEGHDYVVLPDNSECALLKGGKAANGTMMYAVTETDVNTAPENGWSESMTVNAAGTYRVWYKAVGYDGYGDSEADYIDAEVRNEKRSITVNGSVEDGSVIRMESDGQQVTDGRFFVGGNTVICSNARLTVTDSEDTPVKGINEEYDYDEEKYIYSFIMPYDDLTLSHKHRLRVYPLQGKVSDSFRVECVDEANAQIHTLYTLDEMDHTYTGEKIEAELTAYEDDSIFDELSINTVSDVEYFDSEGEMLAQAPVNVGEYTAKVEIAYQIGNKERTGIIEKSFKILPKVISRDDTDIEVIIDPESYEYDGNEHDVDITVNYGTYELLKDTDYELIYTPGADAGEYKVTVKGIGNFTGEYTGTWIITKAAAENSAESIKIESEDKDYDAEPYDPEDYVNKSSVYDGDYSPLGTAILSNDYDISYSYAIIPDEYEDGLSDLVYTDKAPVNVGKYAIRAFVSGEQFDSFAVYDEFEIKPRKISDENITVTVEPIMYGIKKRFEADEDMVYDAQRSLSESVTVEYNGELLTEGVDYVLDSEIPTNADAGTYTFNVKGLGNFNDSVNNSWVIEPMDISEHGGFFVTGTVYDPARMQILTDDEGMWEIYTNDPSTYTGEAFPFILMIDGSKDIPLTLNNYMPPYNITIKAKEGTNYTGEVSCSFTPAKVTNYGLDFIFKGKEYDGKYLTRFDFELSNDGGLSIIGHEPTYCDYSYWNDVDPATGHHYDENGVPSTSSDIAYWVIDSDHDYGNSSITLPDFECDGKSAGLQMVVFCINNTNWETAYFTFYVYIDKAKAENIHGVKLTAANKLYDGRPYDGTGTTLSVVSCEQFKDTEENLVAQEVVANHKTVTYAYAEVPEGYEGDLADLSYSQNAPANPGSYAIKATTYGDNFEEVSFYDTFTITGIDISGINEPGSGFDIDIESRELLLSSPGIVGSQTVSLKLSYNDTMLEEGVDYELESDEGTKVGTYSFTLKGIGRFKGSYTGQWEIQDPMITINDSRVVVNKGARIIVTTSGGYAWIIKTDDTSTYKRDDLPFTLLINGSEDVPLTFDKPGKYDISVILKKDITGSVYDETLIQGLEIMPIPDYSLDYTFNGKEFDGNYLSYTDFTAPEGDSLLEELQRGGTYLDRSPWNELSGEEQCDIAYWVVDTGSQDYPIDDDFPHPVFECDGRSAGTQLVVFCVEHENWEPEYFAFYVTISKAMAENIHGVKLTAANKLYDGKPYDGTGAALSVVSCEQFKDTEENLVAQEVVANHKTVTYAYAVVPEGYIGSLADLSYSQNAPANPGSYAIKATTYGDNFEEVSFYDTFSITGIANSYTAPAKATVTITAINGAAYTVEGDNTVQTGNTMTVPTGTEITLTAYDTESALNWLINGRLISSEASVTITVNGSTNVTLVNNKAFGDQVFVEYISASDQVMLYRQYSQTSDIVLPAGPTKLGYDFDKWVFEDTEEEATPEAIKARKGEAVVISPSYKKQSIPCTVTVSYEGVDREADVTESAKGSAFTAQAPEIEGKQFGCWKNANGTVLGYTSTYRMPVTSDTEIIACYVDTDTVVDRKPVIALGAPYAVTTDEQIKVTCAAVRNIPDGYTVVEAGMLCAVDSPLTEDEFTVDAQGIDKRVSGNTKLYGADIANVTVDSSERKVSFRGYIIVKTSEESAEQMIFYTDILITSYSELVS